MEKPYLLHMLTPTKNVSPFDVNMAYDAGWSAVICYGQVSTDEIGALVQDAIFSRGPKGARRTGIFIGGRSMDTALEMLALARAAMVPPFEVSLFADPSGAFTTAAAMVACAGQQLAGQGAGFAGQRVAVFGGTGPVGTAAAILAARAGSEVTIISHTSLDKARQAAQQCRERHGVEVGGAYSGDQRQIDELIAGADVVFAAAKAGAQVLSASQLGAAQRLKVVVDVNAVPPSGVEGLGLQDNGVALAGSPSGARGVGALAVGNVKYQTQQQLLIRMRESDKPVCFDFEQAFEQAQSHVR